MAAEHKIEIQHVVALNSAHPMTLKSLSTFYFQTFFSERFLMQKIFSLCARESIL